MLGSARINDQLIEGTSTLDIRNIKLLCPRLALAFVLQYSPRQDFDFVFLAVGFHGRYCLMMITKYTICPGRMVPSSFAGSISVLVHKRSSISRIIRSNISLSKK